MSELSTDVISQESNGEVSAEALMTDFQTLARLNLSVQGLKTVARNLHIEADDLIAPGIEHPSSPHPEGLADLFLMRTEASCRADIEVREAAAEVRDFRSYLGERLLTDYRGQMVSIRAIKDGATPIRVVSFSERNKDFYTRKQLPEVAGRITVSPSFDNNELRVRPSFLGRLVTSWYEVNLFDTAAEARVELTFL